MFKQEITKTLSAALLPYGQTDVSSLQEVIDRDKKRHKYRKDIIKMIDERHKALLSKIKDAPLEFHRLEELLRKRNKDKKDTAVRKELEAEQKALCQILIDWLSSNNKTEFAYLTASTPAKIVSEMFAKNPTDKKLKVFDKFCTYLSDYSAARNIIYGTANKAGSVGCRLVTENFPIFIKNKDAYVKLSEEYPEILKTVAKNLPEQSGYIDAFASTDDYMMFSVQDGIKNYNAIVGETNKVINLYIQANPDTKTALKKLRMKTLYKQILFDDEALVAASFPRIYSVKEFASLVHTIWEGVLDSGKVLDDMMVLLKNIRNYDTTGIFIKKNKISFVSDKLYGEWNRIKDTIGETKNDYTALEALIFSDADFDNLFKDLNKFKSQAVLAYVEVNKFADDEMMSEDAVPHITELMYALNDFRKLVDIIAIPDDSVNSDPDFYNMYKEYSEKTAAIKSAYSTAYTFVTQRPEDISKKFRLSFDYSTFMKGWDIDKITKNEYGATMFSKDGRLFVGVTNKEKCPDFDDIHPANPGDETFRMLSYKKLGNSSRQIKHMFINDSTPDNIRKIVLGKKDDEAYEHSDMVKVIDYYKKCLLSRYSGIYDFNFSETSDYKTINDFFAEVDKFTYKVSFIDIPASQIDEWIAEKKLFMFIVHTKDYKVGAYGTKELFTIFFENLFTEDNLKNDVIRLAGGSSIVMRPKTVENPYRHKVGSILLNKRDKDGKPVPNKIYVSLSKYLNGRLNKKDLSRDALAYLDKVIWHKHQKEHIAVEDIVKDKRYTTDAFILHLPITINPGCRVNEYEINEDARKNAKHTIGIDRGERNLLYVNVTDCRTNKVVEHRSLNEIDGYDYQLRLTQLEKERQDQQRNWRTQSQIKHLKKGYVGKAVHIICELMLKYENSIVVMEALPKEMMQKRGSAFGAVYSQFQQALLNKLSYLVVKDRKPLEKGGILNGYQFTIPPKTLEDKPRQYGSVLFVPPGYTSSIDPVTGFTNLFMYKKYDSSNKKAKNFTAKFDSIRINEDGIPELKFDYSNFKTFQKWPDRQWTCIIDGKRILRQKNQETGVWEYEDVDVREAFNKLFGKYSKLEPGTDVKELIGKIRKTDADIDVKFVKLMKTVFRLRNSNPNTGEDYIISPALDVHGKTFDSRDQRNLELGLPVNGDSNGARNIALKGAMTLHNAGVAGKLVAVGNSEWMQNVQRFSSE